ncbi:MAG: hypothetical protein AAF092_10090 [Pseudomonadota bacterium]
MAVTNRSTQASKSRSKAVSHIQIQKVGPNADHHSTKADIHALCGIVQNGLVTDIRRLCLRMSAMRDASAALKQTIDWQPWTTIAFQLGIKRGAVHPFARLGV